MRVTVLRATSPRRRQRWTFEVTTVGTDDKAHLQMVLEEFAMEERVAPEGYWRRPKLAFYKRRRDAAAALPLKDVPVDHALMGEVHAAMLSRIELYVRHDDMLEPFRPGRE